VKASFAIWGALIPCADHSTICARRHVTTDPVPGRTIRISRRPSSSLISRTCTLAAIPVRVSRPTGPGKSRLTCREPGKPKRLRHPPGTATGRFRPPNQLLAFLEAL
jgi:hypothetical protein